MGADSGIGGGKAASGGLGLGLLSGISESNNGLRNFKRPHEAIVPIQKPGPAQSGLAKPEKPVARNSHVSRLKGLLKAPVC